MKIRAILFTASLVLLMLFSNAIMAEVPEAVKSKPGTQTTLIIVRHAEKDKGDDPPLTTKGETRAERLKDALIQSNVTAIYCPDLKRNRQTAQPLAKALSVDLTLVSRKKFKDPKELAKHVVEDALENHSGETVLWIGNQSTKVVGQLGNLQEIYLFLGGQEYPMTRYNNMYIFTITDDGPVGIVKTLYGDMSDT